MMEKRPNIKKWTKKRLDKTLGIVQKITPELMRRAVRPYYLNCLYYKIFPERKLIRALNAYADSGGNESGYASYVRYTNDRLKNRPSARVEYGDFLNEIILSTDFRGIFIYPPTMDWEFLFQRPQQIFRVLAEKGYLCFFCVVNPSTDNVEGFKEIADRLYLCERFEVLFELQDHYDVFLWVTCPIHALYLPYFDKARIIYDVVDELEVFCFYCKLMEKDHELLLRDSDAVVASAEKLYERVRESRKDAILAPNGVCIEDFHVDEGVFTPPKDMVHIIQQGKPIIGYYGAFAEWLDYDLINYATEVCGDYNFVFIGLDLSNSINLLEKRENVFYLGSKDYLSLKNYLHLFDVATIPFKMNRITSSVSPIKLFEYMAGGKPIVTTGIRECYNHKSVFISRNKESYVENLSRALSEKDDKEYRALLRQEAEDNTWSDRAEKVLERIDQMRELKDD